MPLTLVIGPAASGKTQALVERAAARYRDDVFAETLVLVPTGRHGDQFRRRLVGVVPVAFGLEVSVIGGWAREAVARTGTRVASRGVVAGLIRQAIFAATDAGEAAAFAPIRHARGLHSRVEEAVRELVAEGVEPGLLASAADATGRPDMTTLAQAYAMFSRQAQAAGVVHPSAAAGLAARAVDGGHVTAPPLVLVDGFEYLHAGEIALVAAISRATGVVVALDPAASRRSAHVHESIRRAVPEAAVHNVEHHAAVPSRAAVEAANRDAELRALARDIKDRLTSDRTLRPSDFAIAFRQATPRLPMARQVFREFDLPLDPAAGFTLNSLPFGTWARRLLRLGADGWRLRDVLAVLRSGHANRSRWGLDRGHVAAIARYGRRHRHWSGVESLRAIADGLAAPERERREPRAGPDTEPEDQEAQTARRRRDLEAAEGLRRCLADLETLLDPAQQGSPADFARALEAALFGAQPIARPSNDARPAIEAFRGLLRARVESAETLGSEQATFGDLSAWLVEDMESTTIALREAGGVVLAPLHTLHGLRFHYLALGGLAEGEFPAPRRLPGLLDGEAREALIAAGIGLPEAPRASEDELFASAVTRADATLVLSRPRLDPDGKPRAASHYFPTVEDIAAPPDGVSPEMAASLPELALTLVRRWPLDDRRPKGYEAWAAIRHAAAVEARRRSYEPIGEYEGRLPPGMAARLVGPEVKWSASRLESYVGCPFDFFAKYGLGLSELDDELLQADSALVGTVVHEIVHDAVKPLADSGRPLSSRTLPEVLERIDRDGREAWMNAPSAHGFGRAGLWRLRWERMRARIHRMLAEEAGASGGVVAVLGVEREVDTTIELPDGPMRFGGSIDRLDDCGRFAVVVDYKTGRPVQRKAVEDAEKLQLQLYSEAVLAQEPRFEGVVSRFAYLRPAKERERYSLDTGKEGDRAIVAAALARVAEIRTRTRDGRFEVVARPFEAPAAPRSCPDYCDLKYVCRSTPFARWKEWE